MAVKITAWNVMQGGAAHRIPDLVAGLVELETDIAVLGEWRATGKHGFLDSLRKEGFEHVIEHADPGGKYSGLVVASKLPVTERGDLTYTDAEDGHRFVPFDVQGVHVGAAYIPGAESGSDRKQRFWDFLVDVWQPAVRQSPSVLIGDLNTGQHYRDEAGATFVCNKEFDSFEAKGWRDAWIELNPGGDAPVSWVSNAGGGFRIDHALLSPVPLGAVVTSAEYVERVAGREVFGTPRLSDHLPLAVTLDAP